MSCHRTIVEDVTRNLKAVVSTDQFDPDYDTNDPATYIEQPTIPIEREYHRSILDFSSIDASYSYSISFSPSGGGGGGGSTGEGGCGEEGLGCEVIPKRELEKMIRMEEELRSDYEEGGGGAPQRFDNDTDDCDVGDTDGGLEHNETTETDPLISSTTACSRDDVASSTSRPNSLTSSFTNALTQRHFNTNNNKTNSNSNSNSSSPTKPKPKPSSPKGQSSPPLKRRINPHKQLYGPPPDDQTINTKHVSGPKITRKHAQFALASGMMLGIRESVGGVRAVSELGLDHNQPSSRNVLRDSSGGDGDNNTKGRRGGGEGRGGGVGTNTNTTTTTTTTARRRNGGRTTLEEECAKSIHYEFPPGTSCVESDGVLPYGYKVKAYAPLIFGKIRMRAGIEKQRFLHSICGKESLIEFISNAKSGQFFFYCHDGRYMIKTQTQEEKNFLRHILPSYYNYTKDNPHSFISHFYGMYRVKIPELKITSHFVIMKSVFNTMKEIHKIWDLKGSTLGRRARRGDGVHKDLDIMDEGRKIHVGPKRKKAVTDQLRKDANFLARLQIMDYSLLLGVHLCTDSPSDKESFPSEEVNALDDDDDDGGGGEVRMSNTPERRRQQGKEVESRPDSGDDNGDNDGASADGANAADVVVDGGGGNTTVTRTSQGTEEGNQTTALSDNNSGNNNDDDGGNDNHSDISSDSSADDNSYSRLNPSTTGAAVGSTRGDARDGNELDEESSSVGVISTWMSSSSTFDKESSMNRWDNPYTSRKDGGIECVSGYGSKMREIYFGGIIDILQCYNTRKWGETMLRKSLGSDEAAISCVNPVVYADRFVEFIDQLLV